MPIALASFREHSFQALGWISREYSVVLSCPALLPGDSLAVDLKGVEDVLSNLFAGLPVHDYV